MAAINKADINDAHDRIRHMINRTPVMSSATINEMAGCQLFFKCENFQRVGAFKMRGASHAVLQLSEKERAAGITTHSSGNHAQAIALAAKLTGTKAVIVMPENTAQLKRRAVEGYGARVINCRPTLGARESETKKVIDDTGAVFIHPYNNPNIIAGQATAAKELMEDVSGLEGIITPVGGGGLLSGTALSARYFGKGIKVYGAEPTGADDAKRSLDAGSLIPAKNANTVCDGLLTSLGSLTFPIIRQDVDDILTVDDHETILAMKLIFERMKMVVEPSSATALAVVLKNMSLFAGKRLGVILSGGNISAERMAHLIASV